MADLRRILDWEYQIEMPDRTVWGLPVRVIAEHRARCYARIDAVSFEESLEDTLQCFADDNYVIADWAKNYLNWADVGSQARLVDEWTPVDYQDGWVNGPYDIVTDKTS